MNERASERGEVIFVVCVCRNSNNSLQRLAEGNSRGAGGVTCIHIHTGGKHAHAHATRNTQHATRNTYIHTHATRNTQTRKHATRKTHISTRAGLGGKKVKTKRTRFVFKAIDPNAALEAEEEKVGRKRTRSARAQHTDEHRRGIHNCFFWWCCEPVRGVCICFIRLPCFRLPMLLLWFCAGEHKENNSEQNRKVIEHLFVKQDQN